MNAEEFQDAMTLLPEDLLQPVDVLRRRKRIPWPSILATAACFCLLVGLAFVYGPNRSKSAADTGATVAAANGSMKGECGSADMDAMETPNQEHESISDSITNPSLSAPSEYRVVALGEDHAYVLKDIAAPPNMTVNPVPVILSFEKLSEIPALKVGQRIRFYYRQEDYNPDENTIAPYRIEIVEE